MCKIKSRTALAHNVLRNLRYGAKTTDTYIFDFLSSLDCPRSLAVWLLYESREHDQLVNMETDPLDFLRPSEFRDAYTATQFLSKSCFLKLTNDPEQVAIKKFDRYEQYCVETNNRFRNLAFDPKYSGANVWLHNAMIRKISRILGQFDAEEFVDSSGWGPGVSTSVKGVDVSATTKFRIESGITCDLASFVEPWFSMAYPNWLAYRVVGDEIPTFDETVIRQRGNVVVTVPKTAKTHRVIAIEPGFNLWFQKGIGKMLRRRLRYHGIDLNDASRNQHAAESSSISGELATVDFSSASDSISLELVRSILPPDWFSLMDVCRSHYGVNRDKSTFSWAKFSAMGNGFTFELESLIFYASALACCEYLSLDTRDVSVFGDDVIIPASCYDLYQSFSEFLGFKVNPEKSFYSGCFRESCGSHWFSGLNCKPLYLKYRISNVETVYKTANATRSLAHRRNYYGCDSKFGNCWHSLVYSVPNCLRFGVPFAKGDTGFAIDLSEEEAFFRGSWPFPSRQAGSGIEGRRYSCLTQAGVTRTTDHPSLLTARVWQLSDRSEGLSSEGTGNSYPLRGTVRMRVKTNTLVAYWPELGPWV